MNKIKFLLYGLIVILLIGLAGYSIKIANDTEGYVTVLNDRIDKIEDTIAFGGMGGGGGMGTAVQVTRKNKVVYVVDPTLDFIIGGTATSSYDFWVDVSEDSVFIDGTASISGNFDVSGKFVADTSASHSFAGDLEIGDDLSVTGDFTFGSISIDISDDTNLAVVDPIILTDDTLSLDYDTDIFSLSGSALTIASASYWEQAYDWKVASESYYDIAYNERGSQIGGTGLTWDGTELDVGGLDFSEFVDSATLDADFAIASAGFTWDFGNTYITLNKDFDDFSDLYEMVNKEYIDTAVTALGASYYMTDDASGISDYKLCSLTPASASESYIESLDLSDDDYIGGWISASGETPAKLLRGIYNWFVFAEKTDGNETLRLYWKLFERKSDTSEVEIATSSNSNTIDGKTSYIIPLILASDYEPASDSRIVGKLYADVSGSGGAPDVRIYYLGTSGSRWEIPANTEVFQGFFVPYSGAVKDLDLGSYDLTLTGGLFGATASISGNLDLSGRFVADTIASHSFAGDLTIGDDLTITGQISWGSLGTTIDISDNTNLAVSGTLLNLSGDTLSINEGTLTNGKICTYSSASGLVCDYTDLTDDSVEASELTLDYGDFTCNGTICTLDTSYLPLAGGTLTGNLIIDNTGTDVNSPYIYLRGDNGGTELEGSIHLVQGADPYIRISVDDDNSTPALTGVLDIHDQVIAFTNDNTTDIGASSANRPKDLYLAGSIKEGTWEASQIDISSYTNLSGGRSLTMNGDAIDADAELYTDTKCIWFEEPTADDDFKSIWRSSQAITFTKVWAESDQSVTFNLQEDDGTPANILSSSLNPNAGEASTTSFADASFAADSELDLVIDSVANTPTWVAICWTYSKDD